MPPAFSQGNFGVLTVAPPTKVAAKKGGIVSARLDVRVRNGFHVNSNTPADQYLIPLRLTWTAEPLEVHEIVFPKPKMEKYEFAEKPLSVYSGEFDIVSKFKVPANAAAGSQILIGKLRYQACSDKECLPPKTVEVKLPVEIGN